MPFRASFLLPEHVGALTEMLLGSAMPVFIRSPFRTALLLLEKISLLTDGLFKAISCL